MAGRRAPCWAVIAYGAALALPAASVMGVLIAFAIGQAATRTHADTGSVTTVGGCSVPAAVDASLLGGHTQSCRLNASFYAGVVAVQLPVSAVGTSGYDDNRAHPGMLTVRRICMDVPLPAQALDMPSTARCTMVCDFGPEPNA